jgi:hypothetical protein
VKYLADLLVVVMVLPEDIHQEQHLLKTVMIAQRSSPVYQCEKGGMLAEWVVVGGPCVQVVVGMG